jgi:hypothetical protein
MALEWADFPNGQQGIYGSGTAAAARLLNGIYAEAGVDLVADPDPLIGSAGVVCRPQNSAGSIRRDLRFVLPGLRTVVGVGHRVWLNNLPVANGRTVYLASWRTTGNAFIASVTVDTTGRVRVHAGDRGATIIASTSVPVLTANAWQHVEMKLTQGLAGFGEMEIRVEGTTVLNETALSFANPGIDVAQITVGAQADGTGSGTTFHVKDFVVWNDLGSRNNDFFGSVTVYDLRPNADDTLGGWTTSTGTTGFDLINETPPDDTRFISADDSPPAPAQFDLTDLPPDVTSVRGLISIVRARKVDGGDGNLQVSLTPNGTDYDLGADRPITTAATYWKDVSEVNPATSSNWTPVTVDSLKIRIDRTA